MVSVILDSFVLEEQLFQIQLMEQQVMSVNQEVIAILVHTNQLLVLQAHSILTQELNQKQTVLLAPQAIIAQDSTLESQLMVIQTKQVNVMQVITAMEELLLNISILLLKVITLLLELQKKPLVLSRSIILTLLKELV